MDYRAAVVMPCYNTSSACVDVIAKARAITDAVLVVDDGSTDDTPEQIRATAVTSLRLPCNMGKGAALKAGIQDVLKGRNGLLGQEVDYIITVDGDGQHNPADIPRFIGRAQAERADLVIGVRDVRAMPPRSKVGNYTSRVLFFLGTGHYVPDTQSGFRLLTRPLAEALVRCVSWKRYETEAEILIKTFALGYKVATVDIPAVYFEGNKRSHFDPVWDSLRVIAVLARHGVGSLRRRS